MSSPTGTQVNLPVPPPSQYEQQQAYVNVHIPPQQYVQVQGHHGQYVPMPLQEAPMQFVQLPQAQPPQTSYGNNYNVQGQHGGYTLPQRVPLFVPSNEIQGQNQRNPFEKE